MWLLPLTKWLNIEIKLTKYADVDDSDMRLGIKNQTDVRAAENDYGNSWFIMIHLGNLTKFEQFHSFSHWLSSNKIKHSRCHIAVRLQFIWNVLISTVYNCWLISEGRIFNDSNKSSKHFDLKNKPTNKLANWKSILWKLVFISWRTIATNSKYFFLNSYLNR